MIAHFYLMAESFGNNANFTLDEIEEKIKRLSEDISLIHKFKESNIFYVNYDNIYPQVFYASHTVFDFICNSQELKRNGVDRDVINAFQNIIQKSVSTSITSEEVRNELFEWVDSDNCHGLIAFHKIDGIQESFQIIYGLSNWYTFRRHMLGNYPKNSAFYISECVKYFPKLNIHNRNVETVGEILPDFSRSVVKHLGYLNDVFYTYRYKSFVNESEKYRVFSIDCQLDEYAASKDKNSAKEKLTFEFLNFDNKPVAIICHPHLRLSKSDNIGDNRYYFNRIYFHEGVPSISDGNILIGHIGIHRV